MTEQINWDEIAESLITRARQDETFKAALLDNATAAARQAGVALPEGITIKVVEAPPGTNTLVLLPQPEGDELSDDELDTVSGGWQWVRPSDVRYSNKPTTGVSTPGVTGQYGQPGTTTPSGRW